MHELTQSGKLTITSYEHCHRAVYMEGGRSWKAGHLSLICFLYSVNSTRCLVKEKCNLSAVVVQELASV